MIAGTVGGLALTLAMIGLTGVTASNADATPAG